MKHILSQLFFAIILLSSKFSFAQPGTLDTSFGDSGKALVELGIYGSMAVQKDGKIVMTGSGARVTRLNADGTLDENFGEEGVTLTDFGYQYEDPTAIVLQMDGKIIITGYGTNDPPLNQVDIFLARYNTDGSLDASFGENGKIITDFGYLERPMDMVLQSDGKIVLACYQEYGAGGTSNEFLTVRYNNDGSLDESFGDAGKVLTNLGGQDNEFSVALQADGKIVVAGNRSLHNGGSTDPEFALARYLPDGTLDASFGQGG